MLRTVADPGLLHIDTSDYYGPHVVNDLIREALHPYPTGLRIVTKVGARRGDDRSWFPAMTEPELIEAVYDNLKRLDVEQLDVVNLRMPDTSDPTIPFSVLTALQDEGLIAHLGVSNVTAEQLLTWPGHRPRGVRAERVQPGQPSETTTWWTSARRTGSPTCRLPAGRLLPAAVGDPRRGGEDLGATRQQTALGLAPAPLPDDLRHPGNVVGRPPQGERRSVRHPSDRRAVSRRRDRYPTLFLRHEVMLTRPPPCATRQQTTRNFSELSLLGLQVNMSRHVDAEFTARQCRVHSA